MLLGELTSSALLAMIASTCDNLEKYHYIVHIIVNCKKKIVIRAMLDQKLKFYRNLKFQNIITILGITCNGIIYYYYYYMMERWKFNKINW